jgi:enediyne biosynthesis protein E4
MRAILLGLLLVAAAGEADEKGRGVFEEVSENAGVAHPHTNRSFENPYAHIMEGYTALGASVAVADFDGDGYEDMFVTDSKLDGKNRLYRNNGDFTFTDVAEKAGVAEGNDEENASAAALWFDYDNDGDPDLLVVRFGRNLFFENQGDGTFRDVTRRAGLSRYMNAITAIAFDYDRDGHLDLFVGGYFRDVNVFDPDTPRFFPESFETANNGGGLIVFRNNGDRTFTDVTARAGFSLSGWTLDLGHADANNNGWDDLYIACDFGTDRFFENLGDGTFADRTETSIGWDSRKGMNVDWGDFDGDGLLDVYVTNITDDYMREGNFLWRNNGDLTFSDVAPETATFDTGWGWAGKWFDYDHDGWLDLYVVNGWVSAGEENYVIDIFEMIVQPGIDLADARNWPPMGDKTLSGYQRSRLFHNQQGQFFIDKAPAMGMDSLQDGRGIALADFDNDGRLDLFVSNANAKPLLFRSRLPQGKDTNWLQFKLKGVESNRDAVGAQVRVTAGDRTQLSFVNGGNGFASQSTLRVHFGLADREVAEKVEIRWPSGKRQSFENVAANRIYQLVEGGEIEAWK